MPTHAVSERVAVVGLGYVGLPVALAFAEAFPGAVGFDVDEARVDELRAGRDRTAQAGPEALANTTLRITSEPSCLAGTSLVVVSVPTPIDAQRRPDLRALAEASETVGRWIRPGTVVVYESTVHPGVTEEVCGPVLAEASGLTVGRDVHLAYSPERINPGDGLHGLREVVKVVSADDAATLERVASAYEAIVPAGVHRAPSIQVAETAKVLENTQRDLNIALVNELAMICDRIGLCTRDVLEAAGTKWNFHPFQPGLVGGHCIGVDPYYLTAKAEAVGLHPEVILAGRRINDGMGEFVARKVVTLLALADVRLRTARVGVLGLTFKENVADLRNSGVIDVVETLRSYGIEPIVHDPLADAHEACRTYGLTLASWSELQDLDAVVLAVAHGCYLEACHERIESLVRPDGVVVDVKSALQRQRLPESVHYWSL